MHLHIIGRDEALTALSCFGMPFYLDLSTYFVGWASGLSEAKSQPAGGPDSGVGEGPELNPGCFSRCDLCRGGAGNSGMAEGCLLGSESSGLAPAGGREVGGSA